MKNEGKPGPTEVWIGGKKAGAVSGARGKGWVAKLGRKVIREGKTAKKLYPEVQEAYYRSLWKKGDGFGLCARGAAAHEPHTPESLRLLELVRLGLGEAAFGRGELGALVSPSGCLEAWAQLLLVEWLIETGHSFSRSPDGDEPTVGAEVPWPTTTDGKTSRIDVTLRGQAGAPWHLFELKRASAVRSIANKRKSIRDDLAGLHVVARYDQSSGAQRIGSGWVLVLVHAEAGDPPPGDDAFPRPLLGERLVFEVHVASRTERLWLVCLRAA